MADAGTGSHATDGAGGTSTPFKVFTNEQEFQEFVNATEARARQIAERRMGKASGDERAKIDTLEAELEQRRQRDLEAQGNYEQAKTALQKAADDRVAKELARSEKAVTVLRTHLVDAQLRALAEAKGAYNPLDVVAHLKDRISLDDEFQVRVSDAPGGSVQDGVSLEDAVVALLKANPHLAKATSPGGGSGAGGGRSVATASSGSPALREAQAAYEAAMELAKVNPTNAGVLSAVLTAKQAVQAARSK